MKAASEACKKLTCIHLLSLSALQRVTLQEYCLNCTNMRWRSTAALCGRRSNVIQHPPPTRFTGMTGFHKDDDLPSRVICSFRTRGEFRLLNIDLADWVSFTLVLCSLSNETAPIFKLLLRSDTPDRWAAFLQTKEPLAVSGAGCCRPQALSNVRITHEVQSEPCYEADD